MDFVWDPAKARANRKKHRVSFAEAATVFQDPFALYEPDKRHPERGIVIGSSGDVRLLYVVHVELIEDEVIRIVSARKASRVEKRRYETGD